MPAILVLSFICSPVHIDIHRNFHLWYESGQIPLIYAFLVILTYNILNAAHFGTYF